MRISVVVPFWNVERYIGRCVEALLTQDYPSDSYEIIMVDNNSTDASAEIVRRHARVRLLNERKQGSYAARNRGLREVKGEIIAFTDPDCVPARDWLRAIESALEQQDVGIVLGSHRFATDSGLLGLLASYENEKKAYIYGGQTKDLYFGQTNNMAVRKCLFDEMGYFVETLRGADALFVRRCVEQLGYSVARYSGAMRVDHLEIDRLGAYLTKVYVYGRSSQIFGPVVWTRPLDNRDRWRIFARVMRRQESSFAGNAAFLAALVVGLVYWHLGRMSVRLARRSQRGS